MHRRVTLRWLRWVVQMERLYWMGEHKIVGGLNDGQQGRWNMLFETKDNSGIDHMIDYTAVRCERYVITRYDIQVRGVDDE